MRRKKGHFNFMLLLALLLVLFWTFLFSAMAGSLGSGTRKDQELFLRDALEHAITSCYALEGMYPPDLQYMKDHYGLTYDESLFHVSYQPVAANIRPEYFILEQEASGREAQP